jgi:TrbL/VirB6 plasmid conjugal transfer protein
MPVSPATGQPHAQDRAAARTRGRRAARWAMQVLLITGALLAVGSPALASTHSGTQGSHGQTEITLTAAVTPALPGGVCQVPGIGDIGGLVGLCSAGSSGIIGDLNNICEPSLPQPEQATGGIDAMIEPPAAAAGGKTLYDNYGIAGQFWAAHGLQCSDMTSLIGNNVAGMVFDAAKSVDRVTITVYQSAAGNDILNWLRSAVDKLISALGNAIYFPYLAPVVILGAMWLAWQGLVRKRATRTIEGTLWMVVAATAAIALIGRPAVFTGVGTTVSNGVTGVLNTAFSKLPAPANSNCLPVQAGDPQSVTANYAFTSGNGLVDENANELWSVLVCKPWLDGELGTTAYATTGNGTQTVVNTYGRQLLWAQAIAANETPSTALIQAKQATYAGIASAIQQNNPAIYPLFQGNQWTTRLEIAFAAVFAALVAGLLILLIALTLIVLKLGFLLLLVAGPFFLIIGTHPGFGRVIAIRWFEMLVGVLMKQVAIAIVLSVLLYCYALIMGTSDAVLPWALKILMIALVTVAVFIYRKPFQHLFSAVGYGTIGSAERAEYSLREAGATFRRSTLDAATVAIPGVAGYRVARWARRNPSAAAAAAVGVAGGAAVGATLGAAGAAAAGDAAENGTGTGQVATGDAYASRFRPDAPPAADGEAEATSGSRGGASAASLGRGRNLPEGDGGSGRTAPPLDLPPRTGANGSRSSGSRTNGSRTNVGTANGSTANGSGTNGSGTNGSGPAGDVPSDGGSSAAAAGWSRGSGRSAAAGPLGPAGSRSRAASAGSSGPSRSAPPVNGSGSPSSGSAWPSAGWPGAGAGTRQRSSGRPRPAAPSAEPSQAAGGPANGHGPGDQSPMPFWLRPVRRDKRDK